MPPLHTDNPPMDKITMDRTTKHKIPTVKITMPPVMLINLTLPLQVMMPNLMELKTLNLMDKLTSNKPKTILK